jgi:hypothetical protein
MNPSLITLDITEYVNTSFFQKENDQMESRDREQKPVNLIVRAELLESKGAENVPQVVAYAFSSGGRLLARQPIDEKGNANLQLPAKSAAQRVRVLVGPDVETKELTVADLTRRGAQEQFVSVTPNNLRPAASFSILPNNWLCWLQSLCFVQGRLVKTVTTGGVQVDMPVSNAIVEVYEVDPLYIIIPRLPDYIIEGLREAVLRPIPIPDPPPFRGIPFPIPDPAPFDPILRAALNPQPEPPGIGRVALNPQPLPPKAHIASLVGFDPQPEPPGSRVGFNPQPDPPHDPLRSSSLQFLARTTSTFHFRHALIDNLTLVRPLLCYFYPTFVTMQLVATATTDECGHFQTFFFNGCGNPDKPDLYFKAKQRIFPFPFPLTTIYAPTPIACHTHWNYVCGSEVKLHTTHPLARTSQPCQPIIAPNNWVLFMAVGNYPIQLIQQDSSEADHGLATAARSGAQVGSPFGGLLRFRVEFDNSLRDDLGVKYYQMSYRKGSSGDFIPMTMEVHRHYTHEVDDDLILEVFPLGPQVVGTTANLFEIPPALPPIGQWSFPDLTEDLTSGKFPTHTLLPAATEFGKYQVKLDLFDETGAPVDIVAKGIKYRIPDTDDFSGDIETEDAAALGLVSGNSMIVTIFVDNNICTAGIDAPTLNGVPAGDDCGVLEYDATSPGSVQMNYTASHPNGFATHSFHLYRGINLLTPPSVSGVPVGAGSFSSTETVTDLLGGCQIAGFSENLYVAAMATDGWGRLSGYDAGAVRAFVLAPITEDE